MRSCLAALGFLLALSACGAEMSDPGTCLADSPEPECQRARPEGMVLSIQTHCGLSYPRIWIDSEPYRFDVPATENNVPFGWSEPWQEITVKREGDRFVAHGPWFSRYLLVPDPLAEMDGCM